MESTPRLSQSEAEEEEQTNHDARFWACDWLVLPLLPIYFSLDYKRRSRKRDGKKSGKRSDSSDSDSVELMTSPIILILDFH